MNLNESNVLDIYRLLMSNNKIDPKERESAINRFCELAYYGTSWEITKEENESEKEEENDKEKKVEEEKKGISK